MRRPILIAAGLVLVSSAVLADMYQDAKNAELPAARQNLELGTVKSEGGTPPNTDLVTRFFTFDGTKQFEIDSRPNANEYAVEQAGLSAPGGVGVGQGATRLCFAPYSNHQVDCNYIAFGAKGRHRFANGAGYMAELLYQGVGSTKNWLQLISDDDGKARLWAAGSTDTSLELKANGNGTVEMWNGTGGKLVSVINGFGSVNDRYIRLIGGSVINDPRVQGYSDVADDVGLRLQGKGSGAVTMENDHGILGRFDSSGATTTRVWLRFLGGDGTLALVGSESPNFSDVPIYMVAQGKGAVIIANQDDVDGGNNLAIFNSRTGGAAFGFTQRDLAANSPASFGSSDGAMVFYGYRHTTLPQTASNITVTIPDTGKHYDNIGATNTVNFILPQTTATTNGVNYCFHRDAAQTVRITANATDQIAFGATNSALGGTLTASGAAANFASVCLETHRVGQWIVSSTADKTQWTIP